MKKKLLSLVMVLAMALSLLPTAAFAATALVATATLDSSGEKLTFTVKVETTGTDNGGTTTYAPDSSDIGTIAVTENGQAVSTTPGTAPTQVTTESGKTYWVFTCTADKPTNETTSDVKHTYAINVGVGSNVTEYQAADATGTLEYTAPKKEETNPGDTKEALTVAITSATQVMDQTDSSKGTTTVKITWTATAATTENLPTTGVIQSAQITFGSGEGAKTATLSKLGTASASGKVLTFTDGEFTVPTGATTNSITLTATLASGANGADKFNTPAASAAYTSLSYTAPDGGSSGGDETATPTSLTVSTPSYTKGSTNLAVSWTMKDENDEPVTLTTGSFEIKIDSNAITDKEGFTFMGAIPGSAVGAADAEVSFTYDVTASNGNYSTTLHLPQALPAGTHALIVQCQGTSLEGRANITVEADAPTPTTPTETIPSAGSVTNSAAAESAIKNIQNSDTDKIAEDVGKELTDTSSSASTATIDKLEALDQAVQDKAGITVAVAPDSKAPDAINTKKVSIVGAALNAEKTSNTKIELQISAPKTERTLGRTYDNDAAVQFSMTLTNVVSTKKLAVPVIISLPLPSGISSSRAVVLHYAGTESASQVLPSKVSGGYISFVVTGFSDFIITQRAEKKTSTSGGGGGGYSKVTNIPVTVTPNTPSTPAGIFTDVPANHSFASQITWARDNGVMGGYSDGSFRPTNPTNRQQLWMVLARLSGASPADMAAARDWAVNAGVSDGTNGEGTLSRQQLVTMLYRYAQSQEMNLEGAADLSTYPDNASVASYAGEALAWAVGKGIVTGTSDGRLNPEGTATRGQFAVMMYRFSHQS